MEKKVWARKYVPPSVANCEVDLEGFVMVRCPTWDDTMELGDIQQDKLKEGIGSGQMSKINADWAAKFVTEVNFKNSEGEEIKSLDDLRSCNAYIKPFSEIVSAIAQGDYGKKPLPSKT